MEFFGATKAVVASLSAVLGIGLLGVGCSDEPTGTPSGDAGAGVDANGPVDAAPFPADGTTPDASVDGSTPTTGAPKRVYVMTTFKMWVFDVATPDQHAEIAPGMVGNPTGTYGNQGIYESFDVSPDGKRIAVFKDGMLHIADLSNLSLIHI